MADGDKHIGYIINDDFSVSEVEFIESSMPDIDLKIDPNDEEARATAEPRIRNLFHKESNTMYDIHPEGKEFYTTWDENVTDKNIVIKRATELAKDEYEKTKAAFELANENYKRALREENLNR